jgi:hypothetical protein
MGCFISLYEEIDRFMESLQWIDHEETRTVLMRVLFGWISCVIALYYGYVQLKWVWCFVGCWVLLRQNVVEVGFANWLSKKRTRLNELVF